MERLILLPGLPASAMVLAETAPDLSIVDGTMMEFEYQGGVNVPAGNWDC